MVIATILNYLKHKSDYIISFLSSETILSIYAYIHLRDLVVEQTVKIFVALLIVVLGGLLSLFTTDLYKEVVKPLVYKYIIKKDLP
jgi:hypothetical protein